MHFARLDPCLFFVTGALTAIFGFAVRHASIPWDDSIPAERDLQRNIRPPTSAGTFYPKETEELTATVKKFLNAEKPLGLQRVRAILVPHAGYPFSGDIAATAFREISPDFRRVILIAANHDAGADFQGVAVPGHSHYAFPGGEIPLSAIQ